MTEKEINKLNKSAPSSEVSTNQQPKQVDKKLITLQGITTSQINQALKAKNPYPARVFLKLDCASCSHEKRQCFHSFPTTDIPIFFRIKEKDNWIKPKIKKSSYLQVEGKFDNPINGSSRKSFTATSYQLLNQELTQKIETHGK